MAIDDVVNSAVDRGKGAVQSTKEYVGREIEHGILDKLYEGTLAAIGASIAYASGLPYDSVFQAFAYTFTGFSVGLTTALISSLPVNVYHNVKSFFQYGRELIFGKKKAEPAKSLQPAPAH